MGKLLRFLVIFMFLLAGGALTMGCMLFWQRELLKGRTQHLETRLKELTAYIEAEAGTMETKPEDVARDTSDCEAQILNDDEIDRSDFWTDKYKYDLEVQDPSSMAVLPDDTLMKYYLRDEVTGEVLKTAQGIRRGPTTGEGPMFDLLEEFRALVEKQLERLNETREHLAFLRAELLDTITELNERKGFLRERLVEIVALKQRIAELEEEIRQLKNQISQLQDEIAELNNTIADKDRQIAQLEEIIAERDDTIAQRDESIKGLEAVIKEYEAADKMGDVDDIKKARVLDPGDKGEVVQVNKEWGFVAIKLHEPVLKELLGKDLDKEVPVGTFLYIERRGGTGKPKFVTRVKLRSLDMDQLIGVFDVDPNWTQIAPRKGDAAFRN